MSTVDNVPKLLRRLKKSAQLRNVVSHSYPLVDNGFE